MTDYRLAFIGAGNMAEAIVRGALAAAVLPADAITVSDPSNERRKLFADALGACATDDNRAAIADADVVILAVKPQIIDAVLEEIGPDLGPGKLVVSIAAGVTIARIAAACPDGARIIRTMPNTPMLVGRGMVALSRGGAADDADVARATALLASCATAIEVPEEKLDAVTAVSGSGPAYFFLLVELLIEAGRAEGLSADEARTLAETTFAGAAELLSQSDIDAAELRRRVTSPGGTTEAAINSFTADAFATIVARAVRAAADRSRELGG
jgi:pyrroline-5-carboxylate reductase